MHDIVRRSISLPVLLLRCREHGEKYEVEKTIGNESKYRANVIKDIETMSIRMRPDDRLKVCFCNWGSQTLQWTCSDLHRPRFPWSTESLACLEFFHPRIIFKSSSVYQMLVSGNDVTCSFLKKKSVPEMHDS